MDSGFSIVASNVQITADIADEEINKLVDAFMDALPTLLKSKLQTA